MHTTPEPSPTMTSPGRTRTPPQLTGSLTAVTASLVRPVSGVMWRANTGNWCSTISSRSRTPPSATRPAMPLSLAAKVASPPKVETQCPLLSMTRTSPARAASITLPMLKSSDVKSPRLPVISRTVTARPTHRVPGTIWVRPASTPSKPTSSRALASVGVANFANLFKTSSDTLMTLLHPWRHRRAMRCIGEVVSSRPPFYNRGREHACSPPPHPSCCCFGAGDPRDGQPGVGGDLRRQAGDGARRPLPLRGAGESQSARQLARQGAGHAGARRRLRRLQQGIGGGLPLRPEGWASRVRRRRTSRPRLERRKSSVLEAAAHVVLGDIVQLLDQHILDEADAQPLVHAVPDLLGQPLEVPLLELPEIDALAAIDRLEGLIEQKHVRLHRQMLHRLAVDGE